jgi:hypothetical protein
MAHTEKSLDPVSRCGTSLELAGACLQQRQSLASVGMALEQAADSLAELSGCILEWDDARLADEAKLASQRMQFAAEQMKVAGQALQPTESSSVSTGKKSWLKGG